MHSYLNYLEATEVSPRGQQSNKNVKSPKQILAMSRGRADTNVSMQKPIMDNGAVRVDRNIVFQREPTGSFDHYGDTHESLNA